MLVAVSGVSIGAQFSTIFLAALSIGLRTVDTVPAAIAVLTAHTLVTAGFGWFGHSADIDLTVRLGLKLPGLTVDTPRRNRYAQSDG